MLLAGAGCVLMGFILYISGVSGRTKSICAFKGSSVDLLCSTEDPTSSNKWFTVHWDGSTYILNEISVDGHRVTSNMSDKSQPTLTIKDLTESDANHYCCSENTDSIQACLQSVISLQVADLQVKVIPATEEQTVTLMCSTSCPLTENPAAYIWYKNRELLYQDWSPWYQELVSSEEAVRYSCAVKGYEELRAPEVSVDSVTSTCFSVTYAKGRMCSYQQKSEDKSCSITYPREVHVERTPIESYITLKCTTSCPLMDPQTAYRWYQGGHTFLHSEIQQFAVSPLSNKRISCAVKGHEDLLSAGICVQDGNCWSVNYVSRRICALQGSSVNISSQYSHPRDQQPELKFWFKLKQSGMKAAENGTEAAGRVKYHESRKNNHIMTIKKLRKKDSAEYIFGVQTDDGRQKQSDAPGVTLVVSGLTVRMAPSAVVTEGQRVTLTCGTSCPLTEDTTYIWYLNRRPLTPPVNQTKHLVLDPVSRGHEGNYSCAVKTHKLISSSEQTLTVQAAWKWESMAIINAVRLIVALLIPVPLLVFHLWLRKTKTWSSPLS